MRRILIGVSVALVLATPGCTGGEPQGERFFAAMTGSAVIPPNTSGAGGSASFTDLGGAIAFDVTVQNIVNVTRIAIFRGEADANGTATVELFGPPATPTGPIASQVIASGSFDAADITGITKDSLITLMRGGHAYIQVHTQALPNGEIRGQIHAN